MSGHRTERCVCGGYISAPSLRDSGTFVLAHNQMPVHEAWRAWNSWRDLALELIPSGQPDYDDPRRERPTASQPGASGVTDLSRTSAPATAGASAAAVEGRS